MVATAFGTLALDESIVTLSYVGIFIITSSTFIYVLFQYWDSRPSENQENAGTVSTELEQTALIHANEIISVIICLSDNTK